MVDNVNTSKNRAKSATSIAAEGEVDVDYFRRGLSRVAKVIDSNPNYADILGAKLQTATYDYLDDLNDASAVRQYAQKLLAEAVSNHKPRGFMIKTAAQLVSWGSTRNNRRELTFLADIMHRSGFAFEIIELSSCARAASLQAGSIGAELVDLAAAYYESTDAPSKSVIYQHIQYTLAYINFRVTLSQAGSLRLVALANDHSPIPVALAMVAAELGIPRIYVQHAEVTTAFPPLDFEYVVLRNEQSKKIYQEISPEIRGRVQILSRVPTEFDMPKLLANLESIKAATAIDITVYLTAIFNLNALLKLCQTFRTHSRVGNIRVKMHPSASLDLKRSLHEHNIDIVDTIPEDAHLAIVGSSSVVMDLLHIGIPVLQCFELDSVPRDYYGFVRNRIAGEISTTSATTAFWELLHYDQRWLQAYMQYDPTAEPSMSALLRFNAADLATDLACVVHGNEKVNYEQRKKSLAFRRNLYFFTSSFLALLTERQNLGFDDEFALAELEHAFADRDPLLNQLLGKLDLTRTQSVPQCWAQCKKIEWNGYIPTDHELHRIFEFVLTCKAEKRVVGKLEGMLLSVLVRLKNYDLIRSFWGKARYTSPEKLHITRRIALARILNSCGDNVNIGVTHETLATGLSKFHQLKLAVQAADGICADGDGYAHVDLEGKFVELGPPSVARDFVQLVVPCYDYYRDRMHFMDARRSAEQCEALRNMIVDRLKTRTPFSFLRLSDGEGYIFRKYGPFFTEEDAKNRERHWWGEEIPSGLAQDLSEKLLAAVKGADVLGIPAVYRFIRDHTDATTSLGQALTGRGLLQVLHGLHSLKLPKCLFTEDKANLVLFAKREQLEQFAAHAQRVVFIGSAVADSIRGLFKESISVVHIGIPTHFKTRNNEKYIRAPKPVPYIYENILKKIDELVRPGDLVFVAGGVAGKCFVNQAKLRGAVALDVGSALDELINAGIHSLH